MRQRLQLQAHALRVPGQVHRVQGGRHARRALHRRALQKAGQGHLPLPRRPPPLRADHTGRQRLDGADGRGGLRAALGREALRAAAPGDEPCGRTRPRLQEPLRPLQAAQDQAEEDKRARPGRAHAHAQDRAGGRALPSRAGGRARAHDRHAQRRDMWASLVGHRRAGGDREPFHKSGQRQALREGAQDRGRPQDDPAHQAPLRRPARRREGQALRRRRARGALRRPVRPRHARPRQPPLPPHPAHARLSRPSAR